MYVVNFNRMLQTRKSQKKTYVSTVPIEDSHSGLIDPVLEPYSDLLCTDEDVHYMWAYVCIVMFYTAMVQTCNNDDHSPDNVISGRWPGILSQSSHSHQKT